MKVLVLSITAGQGHNATAQAVCSYFDSIGIESRTLDTYMYLNKLLGEAVANGYLLSVESAKKVYSRTYRYLEKRKKTGDNMSAARMTNTILSHKLKEYIDIYNPDVIICTHIFACMMVDVLKQKKKINQMALGILTDFAFHPYWEECIHFDYVVTASELLNHQALKKGFRLEQILPIGIPINPKFVPEIRKDEAREMLGLDPDKLTVLLMSGSMGYGKITKTVGLLDRLDIDFQMITVCGNNVEAKEKIDKLRTNKKILNLGYADNVEVLMSASDCIITKPGGLTASEALAKRLPMIIVNPIPGQEDRNTEYLLNNGAAIRVTSTFPLDEALFQLFSNKDRLENMKKSIEFLRKPDSTETLCRFVKEHAEDKSPKP